MKYRVYDLLLLMLKTRCVIVIVLPMNKMTYLTSRLKRMVVKKTPNSIFFCQFKSQ